VKGTKTRTSKKEGRESKNQGNTGNMRGVEIPEYLDVETRREKKGIGRKEW
jgi:hypothetical protein